MQIVLQLMTVPIAAVCTLCSEYISEFEIEKIRYVHPITARYFAPSAATAASFVKTCIRGIGANCESRKNTRPTTKAILMPIEMIFLIGSIRCCPQYCEASTTMPMPMPLQSSCITKWIWFTSVAPDSASSV